MSMIDIKKGLLTLVEDETNQIKTKMSEDKADKEESIKKLDEDILNIQNDIKKIENEIISIKSKQIIEKQKKQKSLLVSKLTSLQNEKTDILNSIPKLTIGDPEVISDDIVVNIMKNGANLVKNIVDKKYYDDLKTSYKNLLIKNDEYTRFYELVLNNINNRDMIKAIFMYKGVANPENPLTTKRKTEEEEEEVEEDAVRPFDSVSQAAPRGTQVNFATDAKEMTDSDIDRLDLKSVIGSVMGKKADFTESEFKELLKQNREALPILKDYISRRASKSQSAQELKKRLEEYALINRMEKSQDSIMDGKNYVVRPIKTSKNPVKGRPKRR